MKVVEKEKSRKPAEKKKVNADLRRMLRTESVQEEVERRRKKIKSFHSGPELLLVFQQSV